MISKVQQENQVDVLLKGLLTPTEQVMLSKRLMVQLLLLSDWPVRTISYRLKIGSATVYKLKVVLDKDIEYKMLLSQLFPHPIPVPKKSSPFEESQLSTLIGDILAGKRDRARMVFGKNSEL